MYKTFICDLVQIENGRTSKKRGRISQFWGTKEEEQA